MATRGEQLGGGRSASGATGAPTLTGCASGKPELRHATVGRWPTH